MRFEIALWWILALMLLSSQDSLGQICFPAKKIYAYFQPVRKGAVSKEEAKSNNVSGNYYVFIESNKGNIILSHLWIHGVIHNGQLKEVTTPVVLNEGSGKGPYMKSSASYEMVPATKKKVYQVILTAMESEKQIAVPTKFATQAVIIELLYKKKKKYLATNEIKQLNIAAMY